MSFRRKKGSRASQIRIASGEPGKRRPGRARQAYLAIYGMLVKLSDGEREKALEQLRRGATPYADRRQHRCLTEDELRELAEGEWVEIGAHTLTHPMLAHLAPDQQQHEIGGSKRRLEALTGRNISSFAYPYGKKNHYTRHTVSTVKANGFACACSNFGRTCNPIFQSLSSCHASSLWTGMGINLPTLWRAGTGNSWQRGALRRQWSPCSLSG